MAAHTLTNALNPFAIFTVLFALVAFSEGPAAAALLYLLLELLAASAVVGFVLVLRRHSRVGDFWISARAERLVPASFLLLAFVALLVALGLLGAPRPLTLLTLSMGLASAFVALVTLVWKASAHCTVAGHAAAAGFVLLGSGGWIFTLALLLVIWARVGAGAHTLAQALAGAAAGAAFALVSLT